MATRVPLRTVSRACGLLRSTGAAGVCARPRLVARPHSRPQVATSLRRHAGTTASLESGFTLDKTPDKERVAAENATARSEEKPANASLSALENETAAALGSSEERPIKSPYFDTQTLYTDLKNAGFSDSQAEALMNTLQSILGLVVRDCLENGIPHWAAENEAYLFEAACSEIRNEILASRSVQAAQYRTDLSRLQRDYEILSHEADEWTSSLRVELEMEINERKSAARAEENSIQLKIQELNNRITIDLISDMKGEIEALRWQATRRGLLAVIFVAASIMFLTSASKKESAPARRSTPAPPQEFYVPVLATSEIDEPVEDKVVEQLPADR